MIVAARGLTFSENPQSRSDDEHAKLVIELSEEALCDYVGRIANRADLTPAFRAATYRNFIFCIHFVSEVLMTHTARLLESTSNTSPYSSGARA